MKQATWDQLSARQQHVMLVAMYLRNALEDFHVAHLSDAQMKELNQTTRQALFEIVTAIESENDPKADRLLSWLVGSIPDYWEVPGEESRLNTSRLP